jgi:hypothetical protein
MSLGSEAMTEKKATATEHVLQHVGRAETALANFHRDGTRSDGVLRSPSSDCGPEGGDGRTSQGRRHSGAREMAVTDNPEISPKRVATLRRQLAAANERLVTLEREQRELRATIAVLVEQLKKAAS